MALTRRKITAQWMVSILERELKYGSFGDVVSGYARAEGSADQRENVSRTSINMAYATISKYLDVVGHLTGL